MVITIIVLLILAGTSIAMLTGDNGILTKATQAKTETEVSSEKEVLSLDIINYQASKGKNDKLGTALYDKNADNSTIWDVVVLNNSNSSVYGTNWNYIETGTNIDGYGKTKNNWLVNYETGDIIQLENNSYSRLTHGDSIGVTDGLILNLDPSIIDTTDVEDLKSGNYASLWKDTELNGFNWTDESGLTSKEFNFDGIDDYIKVKYDSEEQKNALAQNGFTFEYYGTIKKGTSYDENNQITRKDDYTGLFCYWTGNEKQQADFRFGIESSPSVQWNAGWTSYVSDFARYNSWNMYYPLDNYQEGDEIYFTITLDTNNIYKKDEEEYYKQIMFLNGEKLHEGNYNKKQWDAFIKNNLPTLKYFCIGRSSMENQGWWHYSKMNAYTLRLYNHALSSDEVKNNYQKSVAYHEKLQ